MKKKDSSGLYFIALIPEEPVFADVKQLKEEIRDRYESKAALRSPPHITLHMPFKWKEHKEDILLDTLGSISVNHQSLKLSLNGFGSFEPRVIYIHVEDSNELLGLQKTVVKQASAEWHIYSMRDGRPFQPHMTIAFRDLKKPRFYEAWKEFESRPYKVEMLALSLTLLKHNGKSWDIYHSFPFK